MKNTNYGIVAITLLTASAGASYAQDLTLDFGPLVGSQIVFNGGTTPSFNFTPGTVGPNNLQGYQWNVTSESGSAATGSAMGDPGAILNGPFVYGTVSTAGLYQSANVIGPTGDLIISSGSGLLTGNVNFIDISTYGKAGGFINDVLDINLTGVVYSGTDPDLQFLTANQPGVLDLSFQFSIAGGGKTLSQLAAATSTVSTSYSGSISVVAVPEPTSLAMSGLGALGALGFAYRKSKNS